MPCCGKVLFLMLCSVGRETGDGAGAARKAGLLAFHLLLNSLWDLQIFKTACISLQPLMKTWAVTSKGILEIPSADITLSCPSWHYYGATNWNLLAMYSFFFFFLSPSLPSLPFFWSNGGAWAELRFAQTPGRDGGWHAKFQPRVIWFDFILKGVGYVPNKEHKVCNGHADRTLFMVPAAAPGLSFCIQPASLASHSRFSNKLL